MWRPGPSHRRVGTRGSPFCGGSWNPTRAAAVVHPVSLRLRALRGVLLYALVVLVAFPAQGRWLASVLRGTDGTVVYLLDHLIQLLEILIFAATAAALEKRPFAAFGLPLREALRSRFWSGAAAGLASLALLVTTLSALGALTLRPPAGSTAASAGFGLVYALIFVVLGAHEEFLYRGYGQFALTRAAGFWSATLVTTAWFVATHATGAGESPIGLASVALFGVLASLTLRRTGNLWLAIGFHAAWDWGETYLFGVADSGHAAAPGHFFSVRVPAAAPAWLTGGSVGPEGSVACVALFIIIGIACARWLRAPAPPRDTVG